MTTIDIAKAVLSNTRMVEISSDKLDATMKYIINSIQFYTQHTRGYLNSIDWLDTIPSGYIAHHIGMHTVPYGHDKYARIVQICFKKKNTKRDWMKEGQYLSSYAYCVNLDLPDYSETGTVYVVDTGDSIRPVSIFGDAY